MPGNNLGATLGAILFAVGGALAVFTIYQIVRETTQAMVISYLMDF
jgi:hypothetical protein